jgi:hypothetical protein
VVIKILDNPIRNVKGINTRNSAKELVFLRSVFQTTFESTDTALYWAVIFELFP